MKISIIIVTYKSEEHINACLDSVYESSGDFDNEVIIVDNSPNGKTREKIYLSKFNGKYLRSRNNLGFARGANYGAKFASGDLMLFLNPDTVLQKNSLLELVKCYQHYENCIIGGRLMGIDGVINGCRFRKPSILTVLFDFTSLRKLIKNDYFHKLFYYELDSDSKYLSSYVFAVTGGFMAVPRKIFEKLHGFSEKYFMYLEDLDLCWRASKVNIRSYYCSKIKVIHIGGQSSKFDKKSHLEYWLKSRHIFILNNFSIITFILLFPILFLDRVYQQIKYSVCQRSP